MNGHNQGSLWNRLVTLRVYREAERQIYKKVYYDKRAKSNNLYGILAEIANRKLIYRYGIFVGTNCKIGKGLLLPPPQGIVIGDNVKIGNNCVIYQQVTIGSKEAGRKEYPQIGNHCTLYAGAKVVGGIKIRDYTTIGAQSLVLSSTERNSIYVGVPAKMKR